MIDPDLQKQFEAINTNLVEIKNKKNPGIWRSFFNGMFSALGYVAGIVLVIVVLGWFLNKTGLLPAFKQQASDFQGFIDQAKKMMTISNNGQQGVTQSGDTITFPDGTKYKQVK